MLRKKNIKLAIITFALLSLFIVAMAQSSYSAPCTRTTCRMLNNSVSVEEIKASGCGCHLKDIANFKCSSCRTYYNKTYHHIINHNSKEQSTISYEPCPLCGYHKGIKIIDYICSEGVHWRTSGPNPHDCNANRVEINEKK